MRCDAVTALSRSIFSWLDSNGARAESGSGVGLGVERAGSTRRDGHRQDPRHDLGQGTHVHEELQAALLPLLEVIGELNARIAATAGCAKAASRIALAPRDWGSRLPSPRRVTSTT